MLSCFYRVGSVILWTCTCLPHILRTNPHGPPVRGPRPPNILSSSHHIGHFLSMIFCPSTLLWQRADHGGRSTHSHQVLRSSKVILHLQRVFAWACLRILYSNNIESNCSGHVAPDITLPISVFWLTAYFSVFLSFLLCSCFLIFFFYSLCSCSLTFDSPPLPWHIWPFSILSIVPPTDSRIFQPTPCLHVWSLGLPFHGPHVVLFLPLSLSVSANLSILLLSLRRYPPLSALIACIVKLFRCQEHQT